MPRRRPRAQEAADKTFGLKNKNKSKKVQAFVNDVNRSATMQAKKKGEAREKPLTLAEKRKLKAEQEKAKHEMAMLFQEVPKSKNEQQVAAKEEEEDLSHLSLEEWIEHKRAGLGLSSGARVLLTDASFKEWRDRINAERKRAEEEERAKRFKGNRLTGREFFAQANPDTFTKDDEEGGVDLRQEYGKASSDIDSEEEPEELTAADEAALEALDEADLAALEGADVDALAAELEGAAVAE